MHETMELAFYRDCVIMYIGGRELETFMYENLEEIYNLPDEAWLFFKKRGVVLLPQYSFAVEKRKDILEYLHEKMPDVEIHNNKAVR